eukprot:660111-Amphidinium_carterae.1
MSALEKLEHICAWTRKLLGRDLHGVSMAKWWHAEPSSQRNAQTAVLAIKSQFCLRLLLVATSVGQLYIWTN